MSDERVYKGSNGDIVIADAGVTIRRGGKGALAQGTLRGDKLIPWPSIVAVQFRKANLAGSGYLQLSLRGGSEAKLGLTEAVRDENTVMWSNLPGRAGKKNAEFSEARNAILARITEGR